MLFFHEAIGVANIAALVALTPTSTPRRIDRGLYYVFEVETSPVLGRWAQYFADSDAAPGENVLMPADEVGRWHLSGGGGALDQEQALNLLSSLVTNEYGGFLRDENGNFIGV
jgi:hypothetical protein